MEWAREIIGAIYIIGIRSLAVKTMKCFSLPYLEGLYFSGLSSYRMILSSQFKGHNVKVNPPINSEGFENSIHFGRVSLLESCEKSSDDSK